MINMIVSKDLKKVLNVLIYCKNDYIYIKWNVFFKIIINIYWLKYFGVVNILIFVIKSIIVIK